MTFFRHGILSSGSLMTELPNRGISTIAWFSASVFGFKFDPMKECILKE